MHIPKRLLSIAFVCSISLSWVDCFASPDYNEYIEIEYEQSIYYISGYDLNFAITYLLPSKSSTYRINETRRLKSTFSKEKLNSYIKGVTVYKNLIRIPLSKIYPELKSYETEWISPADIVQDFPIGNLSEATIIQTIYGGSVEDGCASPLTRNKTFWLEDYPLEIVLKEGVEHVSNLDHADFTFIGIEGGLSKADEQYFTNKLLKINTESYEDIRKIIIEIYEYNVIVMEHWSY